MSKLLLDTNVLIYSIDEDSKYFNIAHNIFTEQHELLKLGIVVLGGLATTPLDSLAK